MEQKTEHINYFVATLTRNNFSPTDIHGFLVRAWGEGNVKSLRRVQEISKEYRDQDRVVATRRAGSGRLITVCVDENIEVVKEMIEQDNTVSIRTIAQKTDISVKSVHRIIKDKLNLRCLYARWIPHSLTEEQKLKRVEGAENVLREINDNVIIIDEKWLYCKSLPPKPYNKVWADGDGKRPRVSRRTIADRKYHIMVASSFRGDYSFLVLERNTTVTAQRYCNFLEKKSNSNEAQSGNHA